MKVSIKKQLLEGTIHARSIEHFSIIEELKKCVSRQPWVKFDYQSLIQIKDKLQDNPRNIPDQDMMVDNTIPKGKKCQIVEFMLSENPDMKVAVIFKREEWGTSCVQLHCSYEEGIGNRCSLFPVKVLLIQDVEKCSEDFNGKSLAQVLADSGGKKSIKNVPYLVSIPLTPSTKDTCNVTDDDFQMSLFIHLISSAALMIIKNGLAEMDEEDMYTLTPYNANRFFNAFSTFERRLQ